MVVSLRKSINDRANNYNHTYLHCYLETITRAISIGLVLVDVLLMVYEYVGVFDYIFLIPHIFSCILYFISTFKPKGCLVMQFILFTALYILYTIYHFTLSLTFLIAERYSLLLIPLLLNGSSIIMQLYALYISIIYYIRIKNNETICYTTFEDEIEEANVQLIINYDSTLGY